MTLYVFIFLDYVINQMDTRPSQNNNSYLVKKSASVVTHSDSINGQHAEETKVVHESVFLETYPEDDINVWMKPPLASVILLKKKQHHSEDKDGKK